MKQQLNEIEIKLKEVYLPYLVVSIGAIIFYGLFRWLFDIKLSVLPLKEDLINFWIPFALPWIPILIWLRRRIRILNANGRDGNGFFLYQFAMAGAIAVPIILSQNYLEKISYDLVSIEEIHEIQNLKSEKFFNVQSFGVDKKECLHYVTVRASGRYNENLNLYLYVTCPFDNAKNIWYGVKYTKSLSNRISDDKKNSEYRSFLEMSEKNFSTYDFQNIKYFEKLGYTDDRDGFFKAIREGKSHLDKKEQVILVPRAEHFDQDLGNTYFWIFGSFGIGAFVIFWMVIIPGIDVRELNHFKDGRPLKEDGLKDILEFLDPRGPNKVTAILLLTNIAVFVVMILMGLNIISPTPHELLEIGGNRRFEVLAGEYWRLFSSMFIHSGIMHLFMNLFGLGISASLLEAILGKTKLMSIYLISGVLASLASIYWHENTVSVGASGAIFGLYGLILAFTVFKIYPSYMRGVTWILLGLYAGVSLLFGFLDGIDNAAHIGGLTSGFFIGGILILTGRDKLIKNTSWI
ncbi:rhomboid family intramembrane serine protease [Teredinibacter sp. KSP-S5-2]|uniref:rhomboid family intramembrane serine protease n=1 Tax=Teredinibacter sp. KSP-S5-2 TaxID=3034506 RepID=UPI002934294A|nr:rhomboid family intramembrane serine protease [Teredinibacter sp. KSP-S5-2]WNO10075.1 rhomboid family intramembrane serine protease [Teredinibacter sp. KSP-S5-2]